MSRFNKKINSKTINRAGAPAYKESDKLRFATMVLTTFLKDQFYRSANETINEIKELCVKLDPIFVAKTALYARNEYGMRSVSHLIAGEIGQNVKGEKWTKTFFADIIRRPDDILEILSYSMNEYGKHIPKAMKRGFATALSNMNEYNLAKYKGDGKDVSMLDAINLCHPIATEPLTAMIKGALKPAETWEVKLSQAGQDSEGDDDKAMLKSKAWKDLIKENKLGYFALLRNLRNIQKQAPEMIDDVCVQLTNEDAIKKSLVFPFRFRTALDNIESDRRIIEAIDKATNISLQNVPKFDGKTLVALDCSGSMDGEPKKIGSLFASVLFKNNNADVLCFGSDAVFPTGISHLDSVLTISRGLENENGRGTNFDMVFNKLNAKYDRIIILSDMQAWESGNVPALAFNAYKIRTGANPTIFSFDLQGYGTLQFPENNIYCLAGFSDKTMSVMSMLEKDKNALINEIEKIEL